MPELKTYTVWDRPTRLFHWINAISVILLVVVGYLILNGRTFEIPPLRWPETQDPPHLDRLRLRRKSGHPALLGVRRQPLRPAGAPFSPAARGYLSALGSYNPRVLLASAPAIPRPQSAGTAQRDRHLPLDPRPRDHRPGARRDRPFLRRRLGMGSPGGWPPRGSIPRRSSPIPPPCTARRRSPTCAPSERPSSYLTFTRTTSSSSSRACTSSVPSSARSGRAATASLPHSRGGEEKYSQKLRPTRNMRCVTPGTPPETSMALDIPAARASPPPHPPRCSRSSRRTGSTGRVSSRGSPK